MIYLEDIYWFKVFKKSKLFGFYWIKPLKVIFFKLPFGFILLLHKQVFWKVCRDWGKGGRVLFKASINPVCAPLFKGQHQFRSFKFICGSNQQAWCSWREKIHFEVVLWNPRRWGECWSLDLRSERISGLRWWKSGSGFGIFVFGNSAWFYQLSL